MSPRRARPCPCTALARVLAIVAPLVMGAHAGALPAGPPSVRSACNVLSQQQCRSVCLPRGDAPFECGDWWSNEKCCNGTEAQQLPTATYFRCTCQSEGLTGRGLTVIIIAVIVACFAVLAVVFYILYRKKRKIEAEEEEREKAYEEAEVYLPR